MVEEIKRAIEEARWGIPQRVLGEEVGAVKSAYLEERVYEADLLVGLLGDLPHPDTVWGWGTARSLTYVEVREPGTLGTFTYEGTRGIPMPLRELLEELPGITEVIGVEEGILLYPEEAIQEVREAAELPPELIVARLLEAGYAVEEKEAWSLARRLQGALQATLRGWLEEGGMVGRKYVDHQGTAVLRWGREE